jgi:hypothetical protein
MSNGQFWIGKYGFLYKKNVGVGARRSTLLGPGLSSNQPTYIYNKYSPGGGGVGASSIANRRAKLRLATICGPNRNCFPCYKTLGLYSNNPNGFYFCNKIPSISPSPSTSPSPPPSPNSSCIILVAGNVSANMNTSGMSPLTFDNDDDGYAYLPFTGMDFYFFGTNYGNSNGTIPDQSIYMCTNYAFGFGIVAVNYADWPVSRPAILFDFFDSWNFESYVSPPQNGKSSGIKYLRIVATGTDLKSAFNPPDPYDPTVKKAYEIYYARDNCFQYMQFNCSIEKAVEFNRSQYDNTIYEGVDYGVGNISNITNGTDFQNTFGAFGVNPPNTGGPQADNSYVIRSDLNGNNWKFFPNYHLIL